MTDLAPLTIPLLFYPQDLVGAGSSCLTLRDEYCILKEMNQNNAK